jgi:catechol 2,3-dioxygenase-like lactoylglutathione lyase family enzyme
MSGGFHRHLKKGNTMSIRRVVPDITSNRIDESRKFYTEFLGFDVAMDMGCVVTLASPSNPTAQITLVRETGSATPHPNLTIEVADVDAMHAKAVVLGLQVVYPLTDEPWGVRRFFVTDPNGVVINVMSHHK